MRQTINKGKTSYGPNSLGNNDPLQVKEAEGGFTSYTERIDAKKVRARSKSFFDHFSQARLFFNSQSEPEKNHIIDALSFELGKVKTVAIRERMLGILSKIDEKLAGNVAFGLGLAVPKKPEYPINKSIPADGDPADFEPLDVKSSVESSPALSMANTVKDSIKTRKIAILAANGVDGKSLSEVKTSLEAAGAITEIIAPRLGEITTDDNVKIRVDQSFLTAASVLFDAVYVPGGGKSVTAIAAEANAVHFLNEAFKHCKAIAADEAAQEVLNVTYFSNKISKTTNDEAGAKEGVIISSNSGKLVCTIYKSDCTASFLGTGTCKESTCLIAYI